MRTLSTWGIGNWIFLALLEAGYIIYYLKFKHPRKIEDQIIATLIAVLLLISLAMICYLSL